MKARILWLGLCFLLAACSSPSGRRSGLTTGLDFESAERASVAYEELLRLERAGDPAAVRRAGVDLLESYPGFAQEDHALWITAEAARRTRDDSLADRLLERLLRAHPQSPWTVEAWSARAEAAGERGRWAEQADALVRFYSGAATGDPRRERAREQLRGLLEERLDPEALARLASDHPRSVIASTASWLAARRAHEAGESPERVGERLEFLLREYPESRYADDARALLVELSRQGDYRAPEGVSIAHADRIGLLCPLSGEYAALGQAMFDGALLAVEEHNRSTGDDLTLVALDTAGDEVVTVHATRRLIDEENVIAIVGALLSPTTVAAAVLCDERGVALVSPTATKETIEEIGPHVFQTNLTKGVEARLLARAAVLTLRRTRLGVLHAEGEEGRAVADRFAQEVRDAGGEVVASVAFPRNATDFAAVMRGLRASRPEALFVAASPTEMRLIGPQLVFHDLRAQLLGPSSWNNSLLVREVGASLDRAILPSDVALIPETERERFETLWSRRFPGNPSNAFGLKTYFGLRRIIDALDPEQGNTRRRVRDRIESALYADADPRALGGIERLRMIEDARIVPFPAAIFPAAPAPEPPLEPVHELEIEQD